MGVTAQDIQICLWHVLKFTTKTFYYCARKHPIVSSILILLFILYMFLPSVFTFIIYFSPLVVFTYVVHRVFLVIDRQKAKISKEKENEKKNDDAAWSTKNDAAIDYKKGSSPAAYTTARQRNASQKSNEYYKSTGIEDKDTVCSTSFNIDLVDKSALADDNPKEIREVKVDSVVDRVECPRPETRDGSSEGFQKFTNSKSETSERDSPDDTEDDDEEEEQEEDRNKAVRWTEDDQKNLMDLGLSEIERNKRLESLIARRRSRKYMSLQGRRTMGSSNFTSQISSLQIPRNNPFLVDSSGNQTSPVPGSAPSILLPTNNPFDPPYDPFEEKPSLTGGSFHQEFMVPNQKEMMFCRHESFTMGAFLPPDAKTDNKHEMHHDFFTKQRVFESPPSRPGTEPDGEQIHQEVPQPEAAVLKDESASNEGKEDGATSEQALSSVDNHQEDDESEVQTKEIVVDVLSSGPNSSSSSEATEPIFRPNREAILNSLRLSSRRNMFADREGNCQTNNELYDSATSEFDMRKAENFFNVNMAMRHTPSHSIASDLQVEVSEIGSPPLTNISSQDEVSSTNDGDIEKEINSGSEEMWAASTHLSRVDENESRSRKVLEVSEQDIIGFGFSNVDRKSDPDASQALPEKVIALYTNDSNSFQASSSETTAAPVPEKAQISTEKLAATRSHEGDSVKPEESSGPMKLEHEPKTIDRVNDQDVHVKNETEDFITAADTSSNAQTLIQEENAGNLSIHQMETSLKSSEIGGQVQKQLECEYSMDSLKPHEIKDHLTSLEDLGKGVQILAQVEDIFTENVGKKSQDREGEHGPAEVEHGASESRNKVSNDQASSSNLDEGIHKESETLKPEMVRNNHLDEHDAEGGASQSFGDQMRSAPVVPDLVVEQVRVASNLTSPKSVLQPTFSIDQASSPSLGEEMYSEVRRSEIANGETNSLQQQQHDNLTTAPEDAIHLNDIPRDVPSHEKDSKKLEDSGSPSMTSSKEVNSVSVVNGSATEENNSKDKLDSMSDDLQISSSLEASIEMLRPAKDTDPKETETISKKLSGNQSPAPESIPADQNGVAMLSLTRQEEQSNPPQEWSMEELTFNSTVYDLCSEMGDKGSKSIAGGSECASESITRKSSVHHSFSRSSEDFIQDLFSSLVGRSASASASVTRQSSVHEFSRSSEDFLQDLFKSLVSEAGGTVSNRASRQGSMLETSESTEDMIQDLLKSLQDNPRE